MEQDIRWKQRLSNYKKALSQLLKGIDENRDTNTDLIKEGIIQRFEFTHELAWKVMKDYLEYEGFHNITGSRSATKEAFNKGLISQGQIWMDMIESRNNTVHAYDIEILEREYKKITTEYCVLLKDFAEKMEQYL